MKRVNFGCGMTPTTGWENYDNSPSVLMARHPYLVRLLNIMQMLKPAQNEYIELLKTQTIHRADATKRLPFEDGSVEVLYTSHMLENLDRQEARFFLKEARRVLMPNGIIRVASGDFRQLFAEYHLRGDADLFITRSQLGWAQRPKSWRGKIFLLLFWRMYNKRCWWYDNRSMADLLSVAGFRQPVELPAGKTLIPNPGALNLYEHADESFYMEAYNP